MKRILAMLLSIMLCTQTVYAAPTAEPEETNEEVSEETQTSDEVPANQKPQTADEAAADETGGEGNEVSAPSAVLMESVTGQVIYDKNAHEELPPASVTKVMTMLLIFDALEAEKIKLKDEVTTSEHAASMGGSQVFLEPGEVQTVDTMIKCISVASANDACVAMAEHISGTEDEFVKQMNERAKGLGMEHTTFKNCNGLDADGHLTTAYDIALMSRELIVKYPEIHNYSQIWMENITHTTSKGSSEFGLSNTNKLIKQYPYATGLKTGSTSKAKYCVSATAKKDDIELIAVIMAAPDHKVRFNDATTLLNYGFGKCNRYQENKMTGLKPLEVIRGAQDEVNIEAESGFTYVDISGADLSSVEKKVSMKEEVKAPAKKGDQVGEIQYLLNGGVIGTVPVVVAKDVDEITLAGVFMKVLTALLL